MKNPKMSIPLLIILVLVSLAITSCETTLSTTLEPTATTGMTPSDTPIFVSPTLSPSPIPITSTPLPTVTPQPPAPTLASPTPTPLPTLSAEEAEVSMINLLQTNNDCELPCWWGLTPGETDAQITRSFLETFETISITNIFDQYGGYVRWFITEDDLILDVSTSIFYTRPQPDTLKALHVTTQVNREIEEGGFEVVWENPLNEKYLSAYSLPNILSTYGKPNNVLVWGNRGWFEFNLDLDYSDQGFVVNYSAPLESSGEIYLGCMSKAYTNLHLWDPKLEYSWAEGITRTTGGEMWEIESLNQLYLPIEEATLLTLDEFFQTFKEPDNTTCLETPIDLWPPR